MCTVTTHPHLVANHPHLRGKTHMYTIIHTSLRSLASLKNNYLYLLIVRIERDHRFDMPRSTPKTLDDRCIDPARLSPASWQASALAHRSSVTMGVFNVVVICFFALLIHVPCVRAQYSFTWSVALSYPNGVALDSAGSMYVTDSGNNRVVKFSSSGVVLQVFNTSNPALFNPRGVALDSAGNVYVVDNSNNRVVKFSSSGMVLQVFNTNNPVLSNLYGVALDSAGNVFVTDTINGCVVKFSSSGVVLQVFNTSDPVLAYPFGVALDSAGNVYVTDEGRVVKFDSSGVVLQVFNTSNPALFLPLDVTVDSAGNVYVADGGHGRVVKFSSSGTVLQLLSSLSSFLHACGVVVDSFGNVYVVENINNRVVKFNSSGSVLQFFNAAVSGDFGIAADSSGVYVADTGNMYHAWDAWVTDNVDNRVVKFNLSGTVLQVFNTSNPALFRPCGVALDSAGNVYVGDYGNNRIVKFSSSGMVLQVLNTSNPVSFSPYGVAVDSSANVYVADSGNNRVVKFSSSGVVLQIFNTSNPALSNPFGVALDSSGNVFVTDSGNNRVLKFDLSGMVLQVLNIDNPTLSNPYGVAVDSAGNVYVADNGNNRIVKFSSNGTVLQIINITTPVSGVTVDNAGNLFVSGQGGVGFGILCSTGSYCPPATGVPVLCAAGTFNNHTGQSSALACLTCPAGSYCPNTSSLPLTCSAGLYCLSGSTTPSVCPAGTYNPQTGQASVSACRTCVVGDYCTAGAASPTVCSSGTYQLATGQQSANSCTPCPSGAYCLTTTQPPLPCSSGSFCAGNSSSPTVCTSGTYCPANSSAATSCPIGSFCPSGSDKPIPCPLGQTSTEAASFCYDSTVCACTGYWPTGVIAFLSLLTLLLFGFITRNLLLTFLMVLNAGDVVTNVAYVTTEDFFYYSYYIASISFLVVSIIPSVFVIIFTRFEHLKPTLRGYELLWLHVVIPNEFYKLIHIVLGYSLLLAFNTVWYTIWASVGVIGVITRAFAVDPVLDAWLAVWNGSSYDSERLSHDISATEVNVRIFHILFIIRLLLENIPHLVIQSLNNQAWAKWTHLAIASTAFSGFFLITNMYRYGYNFVIVREGLESVPMSMQGYQECIGHAGGCADLCSTLSAMSEGAPTKPATPRDSHSTTASPRNVEMMPR